MEREPALGSEDSASRLNEEGGFETGAVQIPTADGRERSEAVVQGSTEVNAGGFLKVAHGDGNISEAEAEVNGLHEELGVEDEIV
jgi:hypothetical protein